MIPAKETQAIYGHMSREANGIVSYVRNTYPSEKPIIPPIKLPQIDINILKLYNKF